MERLSTGALPELTPMDSASQQPRWYLGMMSGTSYDAIDVALLYTDGNAVLVHGPSQAFPLQPELRQRIAAVMGRTTAPSDLTDAITQAHVEAARSFLASHPGYNVKAIGFHGQTILHQRRDRLSIQLGKGETLAEATGLAVVGQYRLRDLAGGGEGAPIVPIYHEAMLRSGPLRSVQVNIGGVSNVTWSDGDQLIAFDCGPGCAYLATILLERRRIQTIRTLHSAPLN